MRGTLEKHTVTTCGRCGTRVGTGEAWTYSDEGTTESLCGACAADVAEFVRFAPASLQPPVAQEPPAQEPALQEDAPQEEDDDSDEAAGSAWLVLVQGLLLLAAAFAPFVLFAWLVHR